MTSRVAQCAELSCNDPQLSAWLIAEPGSAAAWISLVQPRKCEPNRRRLRQGRVDLWRSRRWAQRNTPSGKRLLLNPAVFSTSRAARDKHMKGRWNWVKPQHAGPEHVVHLNQSGCGAGGIDPAVGSPSGHARAVSRVRPSRGGRAEPNARWRPSCSKSSDFFSAQA
jgi:hypothetical protein